MWKRRVSAWRWTGKLPQARHRNSCGCFTSQKSMKLTSWSRYSRIYPANAPTYTNGWVRCASAPVSHAHTMFGKSRVCVDSRKCDSIIHIVRPVCDRCGVWTSENWNRSLQKLADPMKRSKLRFRIVSAVIKVIWESWTVYFLGSSPTGMGGLFASLAFLGCNILCKHPTRFYSYILIANIRVCCSIVQASLTRVYPVSHTRSARWIRVLLQAGDDSVMMCVRAWF